MKCDNCGKDYNWLEVIGSSFICKRCIRKHKIMGLLLRTHTNTFQYALRQLKIKDYDEFMKITRKQLEAVAEQKMKDLNANDMDAAVNIIAGTAKRMGLDPEV